MLAAQGLRKEYRAGPRSVTAVADVSLEIAPGEFVAVMGRSGSGKSTLLAMLGGLCRPTRGRVIADGVDLWSLSPGALADFRATRVGFVLQPGALLPALRAVDNVALAALLSRTPARADAYERAERALRDVGLADRLDGYPDELSGGEQRRVALARALVNHPPLLLADEPTSDLDEEAERDVVERLVELHRTRGTTLVLVTHDGALARYADRVVHLHAGRVEKEEAPATRVAPRPARPQASAAPREEALPAARAGAGLRRVVWSFAGWTTLVVAGILALDTIVAGVQERGLARTQAARSELRRVALQQLRADVEDVAHEADGRYRLTLVLQNLDPQRELYVLGPAARVFVQVDRGWREVPARADGDSEGRVVSLNGRQRFTLMFMPDVRTFDEQVAGYYHVRVTSSMLVSRRRQPQGDLFERTDAYYVYVKPHGADDADLRRRNGWSGTPPVWIPMPPH
jgi:putative ABC transport system ATP-binding protein/macrolide transport system ATP-binding/permease protein/lipoprotein-releasing system ATP-binding protein